MNTRNTTILTVSAMTVVIGLGVLAHVDTRFQRTATDTGLALLGLLVLCGLLGALIAPLLDLWADTDANSENGTAHPGEQMHAGRSTR